MFINHYSISPGMITSRVGVGAKYAGAYKDADGTYTITLSPSGDGENGIPTGKPFYGVLRAYVPVPGADLTVGVVKR